MMIPGNMILPSYPTKTKVADDKPKGKEAWKPTGVSVARCHEFDPEYEFDIEEDYGKLASEV
jgi:hypothetical protein